MNSSPVNFDLITKHGLSIESKFALSNSDKIYYTELWDYFYGVKYGNKKEGLYIAGQLGTGKTLSLKIMQKIFGGFKIVSARHLMREFLQSKVHGMDVIDTYGRKSFIQDGRGNVDTKKPINLFIDDLCLDENKSSMYGNQSNVLMEILLDRYDCWVEFGMRTIITTNASPKVIEENYGARVRDRLREMCHSIILTGESKRK